MNTFSYDNGVRDGVRKFSRTPIIKPYQPKLPGIHKDYFEVPPPRASFPVGSSVMLDPGHKGHPMSRNIEIPNMDAILNRWKKK